MLYSEFVERTGVRVSAEEYRKIEDEYYEFPGDKDAFYRAWKRANPASVKRTKEHKAKEQRESKLFSALIRIDQLINDHKFSRSARASLSERDIQTIESFGINIGYYEFNENYCGGDIHYAINQYFKASAL